jgi:arginase family enzyme
LGGDRFSHACPFARIMEAGGALRLLQVGIRTCNAHQREQARRWPVKMFPAGGNLDSGFPKVAWPAYLSVDLDVLDPAFAPGVSHHEPGGLTTREVISVIHSLQGALIGADVVEYNPRRDINGVTGRVAAKLVKEILGSMLIDG